MPKPYTEYQKEIAFDQYYAMGEGRNLDRLVLDLVNTAEFENRSPSLASLKLWSRDNNWQERCKQRDIENSKPRQKATDKEVVKTKAAYRVEIGAELQELDAIGSRIIKLLADVDKKIQSDDSEDKETSAIIEINSIEDLDKVMTSLKKYKDIKKDLRNQDLKLIGEDVPDRSDLNIRLELPKDLDIDAIL